MIMTNFILNPLAAKYELYTEHWGSCAMKF